MCEKHKYCIVEECTVCLNTVSQVGNFINESEIMTQTVSSVFFWVSCVCLHFVLHNIVFIHAALWFWSKISRNIWRIINLIAFYQILKSVSGVF